MKLLQINNKIFQVESYNRTLSVAILTLEDGSPDFELIDENNNYFNSVTRSLQHIKFRNPYLVCICPHLSKELRQTFIDLLCDQDTKQSVSFGFGIPHQAAYLLKPEIVKQIEADCPLD